MKEQFGKDIPTTKIKIEHFSCPEESATLLKQIDADSFSRLMLCPHGKTLRDVPGRLTVELKLTEKDGSECHYYLKRYWQLKKSWRYPTAWKEPQEEFANLAKLKKEGLPVPESTVWGLGRINGIAVGFLLIKEVPGIQGDHYVEQTFCHELSQKEINHKRQFIRELADYAIDIHDRGYTHRDFYLCHTFVHDLGDSFVLNLIDLQRIQKRKLFPLRWILKDISQMDFSVPAGIPATDRLRFFMRYRGITKLTNRDKRFIKAIKVRTNRLIKREKRRGLK